jgi:hypothetical protein
MDHNRCSELLPAYVDGELDASTMDEVGAHLQGCADCRLEETALRAMAAVQVTPMSADERSWLHEQVLTGAKTTEEPEPAATVLVPRRAPWLTRVAPALGAVAALLVLAVGAMLVGGGDLMGGPDQDAIGAAGGAEQKATESEDFEEGAAASAGTAKKDKDGKNRTVMTSESDSAFSAAELSGPPQPEFDRLGKIRQRTIRMIGRRDSTFLSYFNAYKVGDVDPKQDRLLDKLVLRSPPELESQIRDCAQTVFDSGPPASLPAFAATAIRDARDILVLGFAWSEKEAGPVYRYMMWTWPLGGDCGNPTGYEAGRITRR